MNTKKIIIGGLAGGIGYFFLGWLVYGILLSGYMKTNFNGCASRADQDMIWWAMILSNICWGIFLALIFSLSKTGSIAAALKTSLLVGALIALTMNLSFYSMTTMYLNFTALIVDFITSTLMTCLTGLIVALAMGLGKKVE
jgi:hypothetical protein